ncbi:hypothetical protein ACQUW0_24315, partial [Ralstonia pseudosolanacearum]|uniref:hypothetical protein n=1 Tax=Ralstonia pseudosolanacearum TaxID=1310165 RepID=UPI001AEBDF72
MQTLWGRWCLADGGLVWFGLVWFGLVWFGLVLVLVVHPWFRPLAGPTHFLCLAKESKQRKARPR